MSFPELYPMPQRAGTGSLCIALHWVRTWQLAVWAMNHDLMAAQSSHSYPTAELFHINPYTNASHRNLLHELKSETSCVWIISSLVKQSVLLVHVAQLVIHVKRLRECSWQRQNNNDYTSRWIYIIYNLKFYFKILHIHFFSILLFCSLHWKVSKNTKYIPLLNIFCS